MLTDKLAAQAHRDSLTGLLNRRDLSEQHGAYRVREDSEQVAVVCLDVDGLKAVNDELGHNAGDALLVEVADRLRGAADPEHLLVVPAVTSSSC